MGDIPVLGIHEIAFEVRDLERSIAFCRDILRVALIFAWAVASMVLHRILTGTRWNCMASAQRCELRQRVFLVREGHASGTLLGIEFTT
jgi:hypothetical protein